MIDFPEVIRIDVAVGTPSDVHCAKASLIHIAYIPESRALRLRLTGEYINKQFVLSVLQPSCWLACGKSGRPERVKVVPGHFSTMVITGKRRRVVSLSLVSLIVGTGGSFRSSSHSWDEPTYEKIFIYLNRDVWIHYEVLGNLRALLKRWRVDDDWLLVILLSGHL